MAETLTESIDELEVTVNAHIAQRVAMVALLSEIVRRTSEGTVSRWTLDGWQSDMWLDEVRAALAAARENGVSHV